MPVESAVADLERLLTPVEGDSPAGEDLRYAPEYDAIKTARTPGELEELDPEAWRKVRRLTAEALSEKSKDLQLAVWLLEAETHLEGFSGTASSLELIRRLLETYWESLHPEIDEEDDEPLYFRTSIMEWLNEKLPDLIRSLPLTSGPEAYGLLHYEVTQKTGEEKEALLADGWPSSADFEAALHSSPLDSLEERLKVLESCRDNLRQLEELTDRLFVEKKVLDSGKERIETLLSFSHLRQTIEDCLWLVEGVVKRKREQEGPPEPPPAAEPEAQAPPPSETASPQEIPSETPVSKVEPKNATPASAAVAAGPAPASPDDALLRVFRLTDYLREDNPYRPIPYLIARAVVWGHLFGFERLSSAQPLSAPSPELRIRLKELHSKGSWSDLLHECERALAAPENRVWLDLHRFSLQAMEQMGDNYGRAYLALSAQLRALLEIHPDLPEMELADGTPAAGLETRRWLEETFLKKSPSQTAPASESPSPSSSGEDDGSHSTQAWEEALDLIRRGQTAEGLERMQKELAVAESGRQRFHSKLQLAELCLEAGRPDLAFPLLDELAGTIDRFQLENWEGKELVARTWTDLVRCCRRLDSSKTEEQRRAEEIFARLCRLDITRALNID